MRGTSDAVALAAVGAMIAVACMPPPSGGANTPGSCNSAAISASVDAYRGQGMSAQTAAWQARCDRDQQIAAFNASATRLGSGARVHVTGSASET